MSSTDSIIRSPNAIIVLYSALVPRQFGPVTASADAALVYKPINDQESSFGIIHSRLLYKGNVEVTFTALRQGPEKIDIESVETFSVEKMGVELEEYKILDGSMLLSDKGDTYQSRDTVHRAGSLTITTSACDPTTELVGRLVCYGSLIGLVTDVGEYVRVLIVGCKDPMRDITYCVGTTMMWDADMVTPFRGSTLLHS